MSFKPRSKIAFRKVGFFGLLFMLSLVLASLPLQHALAAPGGVSSGLRTWQKADDGTASGASWADSSGNGNTAAQGTAANQPTFQANGINFNPTLSYDGTNDAMNYANDLGVNGTANFSTFFAAQSNLNTNQPVISGHDTVSAGQHLFGFSATGAVQTLVGHGANPGGTNCVVSTGTTTLPLGVPGIGSFIRSNGNTGAIMLNAGGLTSGTCTTSFSSFNRTLGWRLGGSNHRLSGLFPEFIHYDRTLTDDEAKRINSYLGIKYGITLNQTTPQDYVNSSGTAIWPGDATYKYDITGIGRDDTSPLNQKQSKSVNATSTVTIGHGALATTNAANANNFSADNSFMVWGHNNGTITGWEDTGATPSTILHNYKRIARTWHVEETGTVGNTAVSFNVANTAAEIPAAIDDYYLLRDSDNDNSFADETPILLYDDGSHGDPIASDNNFTVDGVNLNDGEEFTLATFDAEYGVEIIPVDSVTSEDPVNIDNGSFRVRLLARPTHPVTIALSSSDTTEGSVASSITIQPDDWNNPNANVVVVNGVNDSLGDGSVAYTIITGDVTSTDPGFDALGASDVADVSMSNQNDDPPGVAVTTVDNNSGEDGSTATIRFRLLSQPAGGASVTIPLSLSDSSEGDLGGVTNIVITNANWDDPTANQVTITGLDDALTDGNIGYDLVTGDPSSADSGYNDLVATDVVDILLTNLDDETPNMSVTETGGSTDVTEGGATDSIQVSITTQPAAGKEVIITAFPGSDINLGAGAGASVQLTFTDSNWNIPQTLTVTAVDDALFEGNHTDLVSLFVDGDNTTENGYHGITSSVTTVNITDNDVGGATDSDNDGIADGVEDAAPNGGDANNDGTDDSDQDNVSSFVNSVTNKYVVLEIDATCTVTAASNAAESTNDVTDSGFNYPAGLTNFTTNCGLAGYTTAVNLFYYGVTNNNFVVRKHNPNTNAYFNIPGAVLSQVTIGGQTATKASYQAKDGGDLDIDGVANGTIVDPVGLAQSVVGAPNTGLGGRR